jgi:eukaryotic-like serine/threonine-protein kinase
MPDESQPSLSSALIAGRYAVDTSQVLVDAGGGLPAYLARDRMAADGKRAAIAVSREASPRVRALNLLTEPIDSLMVPLGHGVAPLAGGKGDGYFVICAFPPGPPVSASLVPWPEKALTDLVLRPIAQVLDVLHTNRLTHRAIRPNNVFQAAVGQPVTLGAAWAAPPAMHQPAAFEVPYSVMCHPAARGDGTIADDVYALGVLLLTLMTGRVPMANMDDATIVRWKLDLGSFGALTRDVQLSGWFADLLHGMMAEDPDHRPLPSLLLDHASLRSRRIAARPARRSQRPLMLNDIAIFDSRTLAYALFSDEKRAIQFLRNGLVTQWLRRGLGDAALATQIEDLVRHRMADIKSGPRGDALLVMHTISAINPRMPLCWRGIAFWPDAMPGLLAEGIIAGNDLLGLVQEVLVHEIADTWSGEDQREGRSDAPDLMQQRQLLKDGNPGGLLRLFYAMNPVLPCRVPSMTSRWIATLPDLMSFLERTVETAGDKLIDMHLSAFIAARGDRRVETQIEALNTLKAGDAFRSAELMLLRDLQSRYHPAPMPALTKWAAMRLRPDIDRWRNRLKREALHARLEALAKTGLVSRLLELVTDPVARALDLQGAYQAVNEMAMIDAEVAAIDGEDTLRFADSKRYGQAIAAGIGLSALIVTVMLGLVR